MPLQKNKNGRFEFVPATSGQPGLEGIAMSGWLAPDLNLDGDSMFLDGAAELSISGTVFAGVYAGLMKFLELEPLVKVGALKRRQQLSEVKTAAFEYTRDKAIWIICIACIVAFLPGLAPVFGVLGFLGASTMSIRLVRQFFASMNEEELQKLRDAAAAAGVELNVPAPVTTTATTGDADDIEPLPTFA